MRYLKQRDTHHADRRSSCQPFAMHLSAFLTKLYDQPERINQFTFLQHPTSPTR